MIARAGCVPEQHGRPAIVCNQYIQLAVIVEVTHGNRVIDLDRGETDIYKIFADNGTLEEELKEAEKYKGMRGTKPQKAWWRFW